MDMIDLQAKNVVNPGRFLNAQKLAGQVWMIKENVFGVESQSHPGQYWIVHVGAHRYSCDCPDFVYRAPEQGCKHIQAVLRFKGRI